jgi:hypothetical protein
MGNKYSDPVFLDVKQVHTTNVRLPNKKIYSSHECDEWAAYVTDQTDPSRKP